jgi:hypothetical protein
VEEYYSALRDDQNNSRICGPPQWPNYQDFIAEYPKSAFIPAFKKHDSGVEGLNNVAQKNLFSRMFSWPQFQALLNEALTIYENSEASTSPQGSLSTNVRHGTERRISQERSRAERNRISHSKGGRKMRTRTVHGQLHCFRASRFSEVIEKVGSPNCTICEPLRSLSV